MIDLNLRQNERKACDAVARVLEARNGATRTDARCPEADGMGAPVDYEFKLGEQLISVEHTVIEAFEKQIEANVEFARFVAPIETNLQANFPAPGIYYLTFPINPSAKLKSRDTERIQAEICCWVRATTEELHQVSPVRLDRHHSPSGSKNTREANIGGVRVVLMHELHWNQSERHDGRLFVQRLAPDKVEERRAVRLNRALNKKLDQLAKCEATNSRRLLVLENTDIALTNHAVVGETLRSLLSERDEHPDEIFLVDTSIEEQWTVWSIMRDGTFWPDEEIEARYTEFNPSALETV